MRVGPICCTSYQPPLTSSDALTHCGTRPKYLSMLQRHKNRQTAIDSKCPVSVFNIIQNLLAGTVPNFWYALVQIWGHLMRNIQNIGVWFWFSWMTNGAKVVFWDGVSGHFILNHFNRCNFNRSHFNRLHFQPFALSTLSHFQPFTSIHRWLLVAVNWVLIYLINYVLLFVIIAISNELNSEMQN